MGLLSLQLVATGWHDCLLIAVSLFADAYTSARLFVVWDVYHSFDLFPRFLAFSRAPGKVTFSCIDELGNFSLRGACFII